MPTRRDRRLDESVGRHGRRPVRPRAVQRFGVGHSCSDQPGRRGELEDQPQPLFVDAGQLRQPLDVTHSEAAAAKFGNRCAAEGFEHQLDFTQQVDDRAGRDCVDIGGGGRRHHGIGRGQLDRSGYFAAQHLTDQTRQDHGVGVNLPQQARGQQPLHGPVGRRARRRVAGSAHRRALHQAPQQVPLWVVQRREAFRDLVGGVLSPFEHGLAGIPGQARRGLGGDPDLGIAPHQCSLAEVIEGGGDDVLTGAVADQGGELGQRHGRGFGVQRQQRIEHRQPQKVQLVGGGLDGLSGLRAGRERRDAAGWRLGQVGSHFQQPDEPLVRQIGQPGAQRGTRIVLGHC